ncbi:MAG: hypothetical protein LZ172_07170 [Thaumarchaeota archaeon]|jgi:uncharacterized membrane protein|nr:hypothetical protein [Candidatus Geocrenenecus arthurdayi]MCL7404108.1 hypothetical protein [Candidatus Geocrenenecus arthurdayi]
MPEESMIRIPRSIIFLLGGFLVLIGLTLIFLGLSPETKVCGLVIIGPIPFFFYSEEPSSILISLGTFIFFIILLFIIFTYLVSRRLTPALE